MQAGPARQIRQHQSAVAQPTTAGAAPHASSIKIVAKHRNIAGTSVATTRDEIRRLATNATNDDTVEDVRLREHLERSNGLSIKELATLTDRWPKGA